MIEANIEISKNDIREIKQRLGQFKDKTPNVLSRAINRTVASIKTEIKRDAAICSYNRFPYRFRALCVRPL